MFAHTVIQQVIDFLFPQTGAEAVLNELDASSFAERTLLSRENLGPHTRALFAFHHPLVRHAIHELKYRGNAHVARVLAELLYDELMEYLADREMFGAKDTPIIIPMPMSKRKKRERGFNQTELLAEHLAELDSESFTINTALLIRIREDKSQTQARSKTERLSNVRGNFTVKSHCEISNKSIIVIDDVVTTGATLREARAALLHAGAKEVYGIAIAH